ncbi:MAG: hypothetical protein ACRDBG_22325, partial [Waterburya sp.]
MNSIKYPFEATITGDLAIVTELDDIAHTRGYLLVDTKPSEREMELGYGTTLNLFVPDMFSNSIQAEIL